MNQPDGKENYGDVLGSYLYIKIAQKKPIHYNKIRPLKLKKMLPNIITIGSVMSQVKTNSTVWGSGIISSEQNVKQGTFYAVRGPLSRKRLLDLGYECPEVYGDPALLLPLYYTPKSDKKYKIGIIPHYVDFEYVQNLYSHIPDVLVIDLMTHDIESTTDLIYSCASIVSSSLHGLIVSNAYGIPSVWVKLSDKLAGDDVKFYDYFHSVNIGVASPLPKAAILDVQQLPPHVFHTIAVEKLGDIQKKLLAVCPFVPKRNI